MQKPEKNIQKYVYHFSPLTLHRLKTIMPSTLLLENLEEFYKNQKKKPPFECRLKKSFLKTILLQVSSFARYLKLSMQYWVTSFILIAGVIYFAYNKNIYLTFTEYALILVVSGIMVAVFFHFIGRKRMLNEMYRFQEYLLNSHLFYGLSNQAATAIYLKNYPYALTLGFRQKWVTHFKTCTTQSDQKPKEK